MTSPPLWIERNGDVAPLSFEEAEAMKAAGDDPWAIERRRVAVTELEHVRVSTVFLGIDHGFGRSGPPILFETMVFAHASPSDDLDCERYATRAEALLGHDRLVERWKQWVPGEPQPEPA